MEKIRTYRYPKWLRTLIYLYHFSQVLGICFLGGLIIIMLANAEQWGIPSLGIFIGAILGIVFMIVQFFRLFTSLLRYPNVEVSDGKIRIRKLFLSSDWIDIKDILGIDFKFMMLDPTSVMEIVFVDTLGIFKKSLSVESDKLPRLCYWNRIVAGKRNSVFFIGERMEGFEKLRAMLEK